MVAFNVQSASSFLARLTTDRNPDTSPLGVYESWKPFEVGWKFKAARFAFLALLGGATVLACCRSTRPRTANTEWLEWSLFLCLALVTSPISWTHYYLLLLVPLCLLAGGRSPAPATPLWSGLLLTSSALLSAPVASFAARNPIGRALISHYFFGGLLLWGTLFALRLRTPGIGAVAVVGADGERRLLTGQNGRARPRPSAARVRKAA
jgi:hypothetical protein